MVGGLGALGTIGTIGSGFTQGLGQEQTRALQALQQIAAQSQQQGATAAGNALGGGAPPAQQQGGLGALFSKLMGGGAPPVQQQPQAPVQQPGGAPPAQGNSPQDLQAFTQQYAQSAGVDPAVAMKVFGAESSFNPAAKGDEGSSFGVAQLHEGGISPKYPNAGLGDRFKQQTGLDPANPANNRAMIKFAIDTAKKEGWGAWSAAQKVGVGPWDGIRQQQGQPGGAPSQPGGQASSQGAPPALAQIQQASLPDIVQMIKRTNPDLTGAPLLAAVEKLQGVMNPATQQQLAMVKMQLEQSNKDRAAQETHVYHGELTSGREAALGEKAKEFEARNSRLTEQFGKKLDLDVQKLQNVKDQAERRNILAEANSKIKEQLAAERLEITAAGVVGSEKTALMAAARDRAEEATQRLEAASKIKGVSDQGVSAAPGGSKPAEAAAGGKNVTQEEFDKMPPGTVFEGPDGKKYRKP